MGKKISKIYLDDYGSVTITGTTPVIVYGGSESNQIITGEGNDTIYGGDGNDYIDTGNGNNEVDAGADDDMVTSGSGNDSIKLGSGNDYFWSGSGNDIVDGGSGNDTIIGSNLLGESSRYLGGTGHDFIGFYGAGSALLSGGNGNDYFWAGGTGPISIDTGSGYDTITFLSNGPASVKITGFSLAEDLLNFASLGTWSYHDHNNDGNYDEFHFDALAPEQVSLVGGDLVLGDAGEFGTVDLPLLGISDPSQLNMNFGSDYSFPV